MGQAEWIDNAEVLTSVLVRPLGGHFPLDGICLFPLEICFAPQRRALFRHLNFQKRSDAEVLCTFWLGNVLRATTACTFSTSQLPKVLRAPGVLYILTCKCASRHNGVQFFISHLASWLRTRRFSEPTFRPSGAPNHAKNTVFRNFPTFSRICIFFLLTLLSSNLSISFSSLCLWYIYIYIKYNFRFSFYILLLVKKIFIYISYSDINIISI